MMISSDWNQLQISQVELERVFEPNIIDECAIAFSSMLYLEQNQASISLLIKSCSFLFIVAIILFPVVLVSLRQLRLVENSNFGFMLILLICMVTSLLLLIIIYWYLYKQAKRIKSISILLAKVKQYNQLIHSFNIITNVSAIASSKANINSANTIELKSILNSTKNTLLECIELESYLYRHHNYQDVLDYSGNPQQLLAQLEHNLLNLPFEEEQNAEYQQLLEEAVDISLSVRREIGRAIN